MTAMRKVTAVTTNCDHEWKASVTGFCAHCPNCDAIVNSFEWSNVRGKLMKEIGHEPTDKQLLDKTWELRNLND